MEKNKIKSKVSFLITHKSGNMTFPTRKMADNYIEKFVSVFGCDVSDLHLFKVTVVELEK